MIRLLANENFPMEAIDALRINGHNVAWVRTDSPGATDRDVLNKAIIEKRIVITFDKDFGELAFRSGLVNIPGIILFRTRQASPSLVATMAVAVLGSRDDWLGHFSVVEEGRLRMVRLPSQREQKEIGR